MCVEVGPHFKNLIIFLISAGKLPGDMGQVPSNFNRVPPLRETEDVIVVRDSSSFLVLGLNYSVSVLSKDNQSDGKKPLRPGGQLQTSLFIFRELMVSCKGRERRKGGGGVEKVRLGPLGIGEGSCCNWL